MDEDRFIDAIIIGAILTVIALKIAGVITISWLWLLSPFWILSGLGIILAVILTSMCLINTHINKGEKKRNERY